MKRDYDDGVRDSTPDFFIGTEVENTQAKGQLTLFCRGDVTLDAILEQLKKHKTINHVYLNSNHSELVWEHQKVTTLTDMKYFVTKEYRLDEFNSEGIAYNTDLFIPLLSIPIRKVWMLKNLAIKIDDIGFNTTNPGVWAFNLRSLDESCYTPWNAYNNDKVIE